MGPGFNFSFFITSFASLISSAILIRDIRTSSARPELNQGYLIRPPPLRRGLAIALAHGPFDFAAAIPDPTSAGL